MYVYIYIYTVIYGFIVINDFEGKRAGFSWRFVVLGYKPR